MKITSTLLALTLILASVAGCATENNTGNLIGNIGLYIGGKEAGDETEAEIGWLVSRENQGNGFATEAAKAVLKFAFEKLELRRIIAHCDSENTASWNVMEKLGLRREAHYKKSRKSNRVLGHIWRDAFGYAILAEDYFNVSEPEPTGYILNLRKLVGHIPLIQVGASIIVINANGETLLELRRDNGEWEYPSGSMELGESLDETAKRELFEETGLTALKLQLYDFNHNESRHSIYPNGDEVYNVTARYLCTEYSGELKPQLSEITELRWFAKDALPESISSRIRQRIVNAFEKYNSNLKKSSVTIIPYEEKYRDDMT
ncbi:hypothetical protein FACS1894105_03400 [Clostridia bacterium]|nr:hypothetical protein FACS1894105_03400 [Clostridia bacterium]